MLRQPSVMDPEVQRGRERAIDRETERETETGR